MFTGEVGTTINNEDRQELENKNAFFERIKCSPWGFFHKGIKCSVLNVLHKVINGGGGALGAKF